MKAWAGGAVHDARFCWDDAREEPQPVSLWWDPETRAPGPAIVMRREDLHKHLPQDEVIEHLLGDASQDRPPDVTVWGKPLCIPPLLRVTGGLIKALQWAADMKEWGTPPFEGPTGSWPAATLEALRHTRAMMAIVENRKMDKQVSAEPAEGG